MNTTAYCPTCRRPVPADAPGGLCPSCALLGVAQPTMIVPPAVTPTRDEVSAAFPELEILETIGQGGMGIVFKARQPRLDRFVALKILPPHLAAQPGFSERFTREARALAKLSHPHIVAVYDFGESGGYFYLVMEFVDGVNLRQGMRAGIKPEQAMLLVPKICEALQFAHDRGVLHRDIKPENILLDRAGAPKLADFGIAKLAGESVSGLTLSGAALGTAAYMAPEQIEKPSTVDHRADIYSLGVVFYEMLTGELPLGRFAAPSEKSTVGESVDAVVLRALEKERERRHQSAGEMKTRVEGVGSLTPPAVPPPLPSGAAAEASQESNGKQVLRLLTALAAIGIPASAVMPGAAAHGITPAVMVFVCASFGVLAAMWPGHPPRRRPAAAPVAAPVTGPQFEYRSARMLFGLPLVHIVRGFNPATGVAPVARGIVAIGPVARGYFALGGRAHGVFAIGGLASGVVTFGGVSVGIFSAGGLVLGLLCAVGGLTFGSLVAGGMMAGIAPLTASGLDGHSMGARMLFGPLIDPGSEWHERLQIMAIVGGFAVVLTTAIVLLCSLFSTVPAAGPAPQVPHNPWPRRIFWLILIIVFGPALLFLVSLPVYWMARSAGPGDSAYRSMPVYDAVSSTRPPFTGSWTQGSAELVAVSHHPSAGYSWRMDGQDAAEGPFLWPQNLTLNFPGRERSCEFIFHLRDLPAGASPPNVLVEESLRTYTGGAPALKSDPSKPLTDYFAAAADLPEGKRHANLKLGIATGDWKTIGNFAPEKFTGAHVISDGVPWRLTNGVFGQTPEGDFLAELRGAEQPGWQTRLVTVTAGNEMPPQGEIHRGEGRVEWRFQNLKRDAVQEWRFQVRAYQWIEFRNVALVPAR